MGLVSLALGYENLLENRQQSKANDVQAANDNQAKYLLEELKKSFDEQNVLLNEILKEVKNENHKRAE